MNVRGTYFFDLSTNKALFNDLFKSINDFPVTMSTSLVLVSIYYFPFKGTKVPWEKYKINFRYPDVPKK